MKKNIIICLYDMEIGGIERSLINMLENFDYEHYNVDLLIFEHKGEFMKLIPKQVNILPEFSSYSVFRKPIAQCLKEGHFATSIVRVLSKYASIMKARKKKFKEGSAYIQMQLAIKYSSYILPKLNKKYDLAISYAWPHDLVANNVSAYKKIAWIHTDYSKLEIDNKIDLLTWKKFDYIASISDECTKSFLSKYPSLEDRIALIENISAPNFIIRMAREEITNNEMNISSYKILSVGRYSYVKGFDLAIKALRILHDKGLTNIKWFIIGYGGMESELKNLIQENNLLESFILLGKKENPYPYMETCDLYVQPSRYEGKAVTVTEAKILGKPILITNYPTAKSQIEDGIEGIICDLNPKDIATKVEELYRNQMLKDKLTKNIKNNNYSNINELSKIYELIEN
ncbi:glycosyltransferase [Bacillus sp. F19]|nr:glycosyltransferase [Bacillus sp. F19]